MRVLNLYAGIGGNRKLWEGVQVTAVEINPQIAKVYADYFPEDELIIGDAHEYLLKNYDKYDFIWSSPPCQTHSRARYWAHKDNPVYPDMKLWQEIIVLQYYAECKWVVENVTSFYDPFIQPTAKLGRHWFWSNLTIPPTHTKDADIKEGNIKEWEELHGFNLDGYKIDNRKDQILRNCVHPETGRYIFDRVMNITREENVQQKKLF